jgi:putative transposase
MQELRRGRYSVSRLIVRLVCVTTYRKKIFDDTAVQWLQRHCAKVCETMEARLIGVLWSPSYFAVSAGGAPLERIRQYIEAQRCSTAP